MPAERSDAAALTDMQQAAQTVLRYLAGKTREEYECEELLRHAVERNIKIIGEAAHGSPMRSEMRIPRFLGVRSWRRGIFWHTTTTKWITISCGVSDMSTFPSSLSICES